MAYFSRILSRWQRADRAQHTDADEPWGFKVLHEGEEPLFDIIVIHGLNGHREHTWTHENGVLWLRDLLAQNPPFTRSRILTYGYDCRTHVRKGQVSLATLPGYSTELLQRLSDKRDEERTTRRPILFVTHSLGGIVLKSALVHANMSDDNGSKKGIIRSTFGILFLGTPHEGSPQAHLGHVALRIVRAYYHTNDNAIKELGEHSQWLEHETGLFNNIRNNFHIRNCFETKKTPIVHGASVVIVPRWSAAPLHWGAEAAEINRDHITMTKFKSAEDEAYQRVEQIMKLMIRNAVATIKENWDAWDASQPVQTIILPAVNNIQDLEGLLRKSKFDIRSNLPLKNDSFVGRDTQREELRQKLSAHDSKRSILLFGPGGVGKTELALKYCWDHKAEYSTVLWFNAEDTRAIRSSFLAVANKIIAYHKSQLASYSVPIGLIAQYLELKDLVSPDGTVTAGDNDALDCVVDAVKIWLDIEGNSQWLVVFDSYEPDNFPESCRITRYIPEARSGTILITTQRRISLQNGNTMEISSLSKEESLQLLVLHYNKSSDDLVETEREQAMLILDELGHLPLAVVQASAYMLRQDISFTSYLKLYRENKKYMLDQMPPVADSQYDKCVFTTWETSYKLLKKVDEEAAQLLVACSFFFNDNIPLELFQRGYKTTELHIENLLSSIFSFNLARRRDTDSFSIHTLIHAWARLRFDDEAQRLYARHAMTILAEATPSESEWNWIANDVALQRRIRIHAETALEMFWTQHDLKRWAQHDLLPKQWVNLANLYQFYGKYNAAEKFCMLALDGHDPLQGEPDQATLTIIRQLAKVYRLQGRPDQAIPLYRQYLKANGELSDVATARVQVNLATAVHKNCQYEEAEKLQRSAILVLEKHLGSDEVEVLAARDELASSLLRLDRYDEAEIEYQNVLKRLTIVVGAENPITMRSLQNLARYYADRCDYTRALPMMEQAYELRTRVLGLEHPSTLRTGHNLASVLRHSGRTEEALNTLAGVVAARQRQLGQSHQDTLNSMKTLADIYREVGQTMEADELYKTTLERAGKGSDPRRQKLIDDIHQILEHK